MGRRAKHGTSLPHPNPRYRDKIRLKQGVSGASDKGWRAQYLQADGTWTRIASLKTTDFETARDNAIEEYTRLLAGIDPKASRKLAVPVADHSLEFYGQMAIKTLTGLGDEAAAIHPAKRANYKQLISYIRVPLLRDLGTIDIRELTHVHLRTWARDYRIEKTKGVFTRPAATTLGNIDRALKFIWDEAVLKDVVPDQRPMIPRRTKNTKQVETQAGDEQRPFIDEAGITATYRLMASQAWVEADETGFRYLLRANVALLATAGFRPGLEIVRLKLSDVDIRQDAIRINVIKNSGKSRLRRIAIPYEGSIIPVRAWLRELVQRREAQGAKPHDLLFVCDGKADIRQRLIRQLALVFKKAGVLIDPKTGEERSGYSIRHYFASACIDRGMTYPQIAARMGTSEAMIARHYDRYAVETKAAQHAGTDTEQGQALIDRWQSEDTSDYAVPTDLRK